MPIILERDKHSDEFNRQPLANALSKVLLEHDSARLPLNVGIFGAWGIGKTQFMTMIKKEVLDLSKPKAEDRVVRTVEVRVSPRRRSRIDVGDC